MTTTTPKQPASPPKDFPTAGATCRVCGVPLVRGGICISCGNPQRGR